MFRFTLLNVDVIQSERWYFIGTKSGTVLASYDKVVNYFKLGFNVDLFKMVNVKYWYWCYNLDIIMALYLAVK